MRLLILLVVCITSVSCVDDFLDKKTSSSIISPKHIEDYQAILDNSSSLMNGYQSNLLSIVGAEEFTIPGSNWNALVGNNTIQKYAYVWADEIFDGKSSDDWNGAYTRIHRANFVLEGIGRITSNSESLEAYRNVKGSALFFRGLNYYQLVQLFCKPYVHGQIDQELGLPLRLESDITLKLPRSSLEETYARILQDVEQSIEYLPVVGAIKFRPSKVAAHALLARVYLTLGRYDLAHLHSDQALSIQQVLLDYNSLSATPSYPFQQDFGESNPEIVFFLSTGNIAMFNTGYMQVDQGLLDLYGTGDLRREILYRQGSRGNVYFRGSLFGQALPFTGFTTAELYLIRAECRARIGQMTAALSDINDLRRKRYKDEQFLPLTVSDPDMVLHFILDERRRELAFRGLRWEDLRRLNADPRFSRKIIRKIDDREYILEPNSSRYVWPIPPDVLDLGRIPDNVR